MLVGGLASLNPARIWTGVQGLKAAWGGFEEGDTDYDLSASDPRLKANPAYIALGASNWDQWTKDNVRQYSNLTYSGGIGNPIDFLLSIPGLVAFKALTIKDPERQVIDIASTLDEMSYRPENSQPVKIGTMQKLKTAFITEPSRLIQTVGHDVRDFSQFLTHAAPGFLWDSVKAIPEKSAAFGRYVSSPEILGDLKEWATTYNSFESGTFQQASLAKKMLLAPAFAVNDAMEKVTDVGMLPFKGLFKIVEEPSAKVAESIRQYGIERGVDGKKSISEKLQNYSELPYMVGGMTALGISLSSGSNMATTLMAGSVAVTGLSYAASNAFQRKSGNVPGMDLDLPVYFHRPEDIHSAHLYGVHERIPRYKELVEAIHTVLASEKDYVQWLQSTVKDNPKEIFELNPDGSYKVNQRDYFLSLEESLGTTPVADVFELQSDGEYKINKESFMIWLKANEDKVDWPKKEDDSYKLDSLDAMGYVQLKDSDLKVSIAQIVGLPDLREWPENAFPPEAEDVIRKAKEIKAARVRGERAEGYLPVPAMA
ncbi:MAG: hypothetical protein KDI11_08155 [Alphaproteobacteria bacterium]|nr:hypothetical protein [Alphaproteobacteria bacterium]